MTAVERFNREQSRIARYAVTEPPKPRIFSVIPIPVRPKPISKARAKREKRIEAWTSRREQYLREKAGVLD